MFSLTESYLIEDGKLTAPLKGVNLIGNGPDVLRRVDMLGTDFELSRRHLDLRQGRPVRAGRASARRPMKIAAITVGGTKTQ